MAHSKLDKDLATLSAAISNTKNLICAFQSPPQTSTISPSPGPSPHPNPLAVLSDASKILKAQTTKLSLLLLNQPFTPSEIAHILQSLANSCLPALATVLDLCPAEKYTDFLRWYIKACLSSIWRELLSLLKSIPTEKKDIEKLENEGTLLSTGVLWATCDKLVSVGADGMSVVGSDAVKESQALLQDAIDELDEWDPEDDDADEDDGKDGEADAVPTVYTPTTSDDESLAEGMHKTMLNPIIASKARALKHLRLVRLLYPAFNKHRIKTFTNIKRSTSEADLPSSINVQVFDGILVGTRSFTEEADEIAGALYAGDPEEVDRRLNVLISKAKACVNLSRPGYDGKEDVFGEWSQKWIARSEELSP